MKIHGIKYENGDVVRMKKSTESDGLEPFCYCCIRDIYVYEDEKIFNVETLNIVQYYEHCRAIEVKMTGQTLWNVYANFFCHEMLPLKKRDGRLYLVEQQFWMCNE